MTPTPTIEIKTLTRARLGVRHDGVPVLFVINPRVVDTRRIRGALTNIFASHVGEWRRLWPRVRYAIVGGDVDALAQSDKASQHDPPRRIVVEHNYATGKDVCRLVRHAP